MYIGLGTTDGFGMYSPLAKGGGEGDSNCCWIHFSKSF